jgi:hypothetical protein
MRKIILSLIALPLFFVGFVAGCSEEDPSFDNQAACENWVSTYNELECTSGAQLDPATACGGYTDTTVDCSAIFNCWADNMMCEDLGGVMVINNYLEGCPTSCT